MAVKQQCSSASVQRCIRAALKPTCGRLWVHVGRHNRASDGLETGRSAMHWPRGAPVHMPAGPIWRTVVMGFGGRMTSLSVQVWLACFADLAAQARTAAAGQRPASGLQSPRSIVTPDPIHPPPSYYSYVLHSKRRPLPRPRPAPILPSCCTAALLQPPLRANQDASARIGPSSER